MSSDAPIPKETIEKNVRDLREQVRAAEAEVDRLRAQLEWWETGQRLFGDGFDSESDEEVTETGPPPASLNGSRPTLREGILKILGEQPNKTWKVETIISELRARDWLGEGKNAERHTRSMLAEMHRKGQARRIARGKYRLPRLPTGDQ